MSALVTKWRNNIRMVDGVRCKWSRRRLGVLYRDTFDSHACFFPPPSVRTPRQQESWANRVIMAEARKRLKHAQRIVRALGGET